MQVFNFEQFSVAPLNELDPFYSLLTLSAQYLAAQTMSNEGMALGKLAKHSLALSRLSCATFLDQTYFKAHQRAGQIYLEQQMFQEAEIEYGFASVLCPDQGLSNTVKDCRKQAAPFMRKDYYGILEVEKTIDVDTDDYQKKYRKICAKWHPDRYARDPVMKRFAQTKFRQIQEADTVLRDKTKKMIYDQGGDPVNEGAGGMGGGFDMGGFPGGVRINMGDMGGMGGIDISQIFQMMGGMGGMGGMGQPQVRVNGRQAGAQPRRQGRPGQGGQGGQGAQGGQGGLPPGFENIFDQFF